MPDNLQRTIDILQKEMGPAMKELARASTGEEIVDQAAMLGQKLSGLSREMRKKLPQKYNAEIVQNLELLYQILNNLAGIKMGYYLDKMENKNG